MERGCLPPSLHKAPAASLSAPSADQQLCSSAQSSRLRLSVSSRCKHPCHWHDTDKQSTDTMHLTQLSLVTGMEQSIHRHNPPHTIQPCHWHGTHNPPSNTVHYTSCNLISLHRAQKNSTTFIFEHIFTTTGWKLFYIFSV